MRVANTKNNLQLLRALFSSSSSKRHTTHSIYCVAAVLVAAAALLLLLQANIAEAAVVQCFQASPGVATHARSRTRAAATMGMPLSSGYTITAMMLPWNGGDQTAAESEAASVLGVAADSVSRDDDDAAPKKTIMTGLYVHIPYCRRRCRYCNFAIVPIGNHHQIHHAEADDDSTATSDGNDADGSLAVAEAAQARGFRAMDQTYADALLQELSLLQKRGDDDGTSIIGEETINSETQTRKRKRRIPLRSIYFGGGTPSLAPIETLRRIMSAILDQDRSPFAVPVVNTNNNSIAMTDTDTGNCEITIELDPGTFTLEKLQALKEIGFNRLSLGVQSFDDRVLESLGRVHRSKDIFESIAMIQSVYGDQANYSLDLISGLPGLSLGLWIETLATAVQLKPRPVHLSIYDLQVERVSIIGTVMMMLVPRYDGVCHRAEVTKWRQCETCFWNC